MTLKNSSEIGLDLCNNIIVGKDNGGPKMDIKELQKTEALKRMKALHILPSVIRDFKRENVVYYSERISKIYDGILYFISNNEKYAEIVKKLEQKHNVLVYHAQLTHTTIGDMLSLLYVSNTQDEWDSDNTCLSRGESCAYVCNVDDPDLSEFGWIGITPRNGGVSRTW